MAEMTGKFLAWDLETARVDVPDGDDLMAHLPTLGISCAATLTSDGILQTWNGLLDKMVPEQCRKLVGYLLEMNQQGYTIVTYNGASFDFRVLAQESGAWETCKKLALDHIDLMFHFFCERGFAVGLNAVARGMGTPTKSGHGADAPRMWAAGQRQAVLDYVAQDVRVLMNVFQAVRKIGYVKWISKSDKLCTWMPSSKRLLTVKEAMMLPEPDTSWMTNHWGRQKFIGWLKDEH